MTLAEQVISGARRGAFRESLAELLGLARDHASPFGWEAAAAAIQILFWEDRFAEAAQLAEDLIVGTAPAGGEICDQDVPFDTAFLGAQIHAGLEAAPRLVRVAESVPTGRVLQEELLWTASSLAERPVVDMLPNAGAWGGEAKPLEGVIGADLVGREYQELSARQQRVVWQALHSANDFPKARDLSERTGETPEQHAICVWMAGWYATEGALAEGEEMLLAAHRRWWPYQAWDAIPDSMVLHPTLRLVCTDRVREYYLTRPIGPEAEKAQ
ncbi:hypothetical protein [Streptacidiphilus sp. EB103A]|uniref:hypothetical protein n=1 Tax=Streptacidiphilus sp. EB103A TaxID=3156275 RepID=UPI00351139EB